MNIQKINEIIAEMKKALEIDKSGKLTLYDIGIVKFENGKVDHYAFYNGQGLPEWYYKGEYEDLWSYWNDFKEDGEEYTFKNIKELLEELLNN